MEKKNNFAPYLIGGNIKDFFDRLSDVFPGGKVALLCQKEEDGYDLTTRFPSDYKVTFCVEKAGSFPPKSEEIRFVVAVGGPSILSPLENYFGGVKFCYLTNAVDYRFLLPLKNTFFPEFVYLKHVVWNDKKAIFELYAQLFALWAESKLILHGQSRFPFCDRELNDLCLSCERILNGESDRKEFFPKGTDLMNRLCTALQERNCPFISAKTAEKLENDANSIFVSAFFLLHLVENFTKCPNRAILIPSAGKEEPLPTLDHSLLPEKETIKKFARKLQAIGYGKEKTFSYLRLMKAVEQVSPAHPLLSVMQAKGYLKGLQDERFTRD